MELPDHLHARASEIVSAEFNATLSKSLWVVVLGLSPFLDGDQWCFLWGKDIQDGVAGFGNTPHEAMYDFEKAMYGAAPKRKKHTEG